MIESLRSRQALEGLLVPPRFVLLNSLQRELPRSVACTVYMLFMSIITAMTAMTTRIRLRKFMIVPIDYRAEM